MFRKIEIDLDSEVRGKNPQKALPQVLKQATIQKERVMIAAVIAVIGLGATIIGFAVDWLNLWWRAFAALLMVGGVLGVLGDLHLYFYQVAKASAIRKKMMDTEQDSGGNVG